MNRTDEFCDHVDGIIQHVRGLKRIAGLDDDRLRENLFKRSDDLVKNLVSSWANDGGIGRGLVERFGLDDMQAMGRKGVDFILEILK